MPEEPTPEGSERLIGRATFTEALLEAIDGEPPSAHRTRAVDAVLVALMDHGLTPSSLTTRLVLDGAPDAVPAAVAAGLLAIGPRFLGTIEDCAALLVRIVARPGDAVAATEAEVAALLARGERVPGVGHNLHRAGDLRVAELRAVGTAEGIAGPHLRAFDALPAAVEAQLGRRLEPNAAGAVAAVLSDLGYGPADLRGFALVARCGGLFAHVLDERRRPLARRVWEAARSETTA